MIPYFRASLPSEPHFFRFENLWDQKSDPPGLSRRFRERHVTKMPECSQRRLLESLAGYIESMVREAGARDEGKVLDVDSYMTHRRDNGASQPVFSLFDFVHGVEVPDGVYESSDYMRICWCAVDAMTITNVSVSMFSLSPNKRLMDISLQDLYSYNMEQAMGHTGNNILTVLMTHKDLSLQAAADHVGEHWKTLLSTFLDAKKRLPSWGAEADREVALYAMAFERWVIGNMNWSFETPRYFGPARFDVRRTGIVHLRLREIEEEEEEDGEDC